MKFKELQPKKDAELLSDLAALQEKQRELTFKHHSQELKNVKEISYIKRQIAQIMTLLGQRKNA